MTAKSLETKQLKKIVMPLLEWYDRSARILPWREEPTPYRVWVSEIMLQQTRVEAVKPYFERFINALPDIESLAYVEEERLMKLWEGLGYYNRVRNMQKAARVVMEQYNGQLPASYENLLNLPGIGEYTAGAIASIAFGQAIPAVDGNVLRVAARVLANGSDIMQASVKKNYREWIQAVLPKNRAGDFNQALMELGATVCLPNGMPLCEKCPVAPFCEANQQNRVMDFPVKAPKKARRAEERTVFVLQYDGKTALRQRSGHGLLARMWEFPNIEGELSEERAEEFLAKLGIVVSEIESMGYAKHIFTHIEWHMKGYLVKLSEDILPIDWVWASEQEMKDNFALPSAFKAYIIKALF